MFYVATAAAVVTLLVWAAVGNTADGVIRTVTVLVIACPHALGLAIPLVISIIVAANAQLLRRLDLRPHDLTTDQEG